MTKRRTGWLLAALAIVMAGGLRADDAEQPSIKDIMTKAHKGGNSIVTSVGKELRGDSPNWEDVQKKSKELVRLGTALGKNDPPQGKKTSWDTLTKQYLDNAKTLKTAADEKDQSAAKAAHQKLARSCMACHRVHKPS